MLQAKPSNHVQAKIYFCKNATGYTIKSNHQSCNIVLLLESRAQHVLGNNTFYASAQNKSLCYVKHAAPVQTVFGCLTVKFIVSLNIFKQTPRTYEIPCFCLRTAGGKRHVITNAEWC